MDIKEYMFRKELTGVQLAKDLGCSRFQIAKLRRKDKVSKRFAQDLVRHTNGLISLAEIPHNDLYAEKNNGDEAA